MVPVRGFAGACGNGVDVDVEETAVRGNSPEFGQAGFFEDFTPGRGFDVSILGLDVSSGLEPPSEPDVMDEQEAMRVGREDEGAHGEVPGAVVAATETVLAAGSEVAHRLEVPAFVDIEGPMTGEGFMDLGEQGTSHRAHGDPNTGIRTPHVQNPWDRAGGSLHACSGQVLYGKSAVLDSTPRALRRGTA